MVNREPFNPFIAEYLCQRIASLTEEEYKNLSASERHSIYTSGKIRKFVKQKSIFSILRVLTKIGINWGLYIIDKSFDLIKFAEMYEDKTFVHNKNTIGEALKEQKSFITDSKQFAELSLLMSNSSHSSKANYNRRYIDFSEKITSKVKENFDNYDLLNEEVEYKKVSDGTKIMLELFMNIPAISRVCKTNNITLSNFSILCKLRYNSDFYYTHELLSREMGYRCSVGLKELEKECLIDIAKKHYYINTKGVLLTGKIFSEILSLVNLS